MTIETGIALVILAAIIVPTLWYVWTTRDDDLETMSHQRDTMKALNKENKT